ncbi:MAG: hypothetical protein KKH28_07975 [Elusimicrobia bacterium]|nr:hypothetical protein [Elusimicrobiota bacterium]
MGEHIKKELHNIEGWLTEKYGKSPSRTLDHIYSKNYKLRWKPRDFEADYINLINGKLVVLDVIGPGDEWRSVVGKMVCFLANAGRASENYEVWIVTDFDADPKTAQMQGPKKTQYIEGWKEYFWELKSLLDQTLKPDVAGRLKMFHFDGKALRPIY